MGWRQSSVLAASPQARPALPRFSFSYSSCCFLCPLSPAPSGAVRRSDGEDVQELDRCGNAAARKPRESQFYHQKFIPLKIHTIKKGEIHMSNKAQATEK